VGKYRNRKSIHYSKTSLLGTVVYITIHLAMEKRKLKVAVYIRVSTEDQENRSTYENQMNVIERYIENRNESLELAGEEYVYKDL
jgi:hypothetical protein